ncbi:MAG: DUF2892 domain-containing protein [Deltaproteobacteria bacterium]|nr:DUF2892 domain-containing protein [Deltaproteobacteria bacterium]
MKKNIGILDRIIRIIFAVLILELFRTGRVLNGVLALFLGVLALLLIITGLIAYCPLYSLFNILTNGKAAPGEKR